jgi:hypothetical protein
MSERETDDALANALPDGYHAVIDTTPLLGQTRLTHPYWVLAEIAKERGRQDAKWGEQNHPLVDPSAVEQPTMVLGQMRTAYPARLFDFYGLPTATYARKQCQQAAREGRSTWADIILEEFCEFIEAAGLGDEAGARAELRQLAAVAVAAIQAMDRRKP